VNHSTFDTNKYEQFASDMHQAMIDAEEAVFNEVWEREMEQMIADFNDGKEWNYEVMMVDALCDRTFEEGDIEF
jgi:hypothetical protein